MSRFRCYDPDCRKLFEPTAADRECRAEGIPVSCPECYAAETEAENRSLDAAESGSGREQMLDALYHAEHGDE